MMTLIRVVLFVSTIIYLEGKFISNKKQKKKQEQEKPPEQNKTSKTSKPTKDSILITR